MSRSSWIPGCPSQSLMPGRGSKTGGGAQMLPESETERTLGTVLPCRILVLSFSGKGHMRGVRSAGLEIESWHLPSTWIPCQASCICGFLYTPSTLLLKAPALADPSAWNILPWTCLWLPTASFWSLLQCGSCHCPGPSPPHLDPALCFSLPDMLCV